MRVMVIVKASKDSEAGVMPSEQLLTEMGKFNEELVNAGVMLAGEGLKPSSAGARVLFSGKNRSVTKGPFTETTELVAGFWLWNVKSLEDAIEWVKRCPNPMLEDSVIEIRPVFEMEDFGDAMSPELQEQEQRMRETLESRAASSVSLEAPRFEQCNGMVVAGPKQTYTMETRVNIPKQWERFAPQIGKVPGQVGTSTYGVCLNFTENCGFDYLCGVEVSGKEQLPAGFEQVQLPSQRYAVFTHRGHVSKIPETIQAIFQQWVPTSGAKVADTPSFERYTDEFDPKTGQGGTEIWIPLQA